MSLLLISMIRLFRMCEIGEITKECGAATPGLAKMYAIDTSDIISIPSPNSSWTVTGDVILKAGAFWKEIAFVEQKAGLTDEIADAVGGGFSKNIALKLPKYAPQSNKWINNAIGARFVVAVADNNDQIILVGNKIAGMRLQKGTGTTGQKSGDENGWDVQLSAEGLKPCYFYTGAIVLEESETTEFDTIFNHASSNSITTSGMTGTFSSDPDAVDAAVTFKIKLIPGASDTPIRMDVLIGSTQRYVFDAPGEYAGRPFEFVYHGTTYTGNVTDPQVVL